MESRSPSNRSAINITIAALLDLFGLFLMMACRPPTAPILLLIIMLTCEIGLIALAIHQWSIYLKAYIAFEVEMRIRE
jgi:hypothetical protein